MKHGYGQLASGAIAAALCVVAGCSVEQRGGRSEVSAAQFRDPDAPVAAALPAPEPYRVVPREEAGGGVLEVSAGTGEPLISGPAPAMTSGRATLDAVVGQINGRPVYAGEFLTPLEGVLRANVEKYPDEARWTQEATRVILEQLRSQVRDELILAEARSSLTPQQRQGIQYFLEQIRGNIVNVGGGGEVTAQERLLEREGVTIEQKAASQLEAELIRKELGERVLSRVHVSRREILEEYERRYREFNPPPTAVFRMVQVKAADEAAARAVTEHVGGGAPFSEVASSPTNLFASAQGGLVQRDFDGSFPEGTFFPSAALNDAARSLKLGGTVGPIETTLGGEARLAWIHLERIDEKPGVPLYDAQLAIQRQLRERRFDDESSRYFEELVAGGSFTDLRQMTEQLLAVAKERYYKPGS